jgi:hypothetical protein
MTPLEKLRHLRELAAKATPRPWEVRREDGGGGFIDYQIHDGRGGHLAACSEMASDHARPDADYIAAAANLLPALVDVAESCLAWAEDMDACHLCGFGALPAYANARQPIEDQRQTEHDDDCPVLALTRALEADHG